MNRANSSGGDEIRPWAPEAVYSLRPGWFLDREAQAAIVSLGLAIGLAFLIVALCVATGIAFGQWVGVW